MNTGWNIFSNIENDGKEVVVGFNRFVVVEISTKHIIGEYPSGNQVVYYKDKKSQQQSFLRCADERVYNNEEIEVFSKPTIKKEEDLDVVISDFVKKIRELSKDNVVSFELFVNFESYEVKNTTHTPNPIKTKRNLSGELVK